MSDIDDAEETTLAKLSRAFARVMGKGDESADEATDDASGDVQVDDGAVASSVGEDESAPVDNCPISPATIVEAILFVGHPQNEPITSDAIARLLRGVESDEVEAIISELNEDYVATGKPYTIAGDAGGYSMRLKDEFEPVRDRFYGRIREARLSQQAIDILAVVAYNQPITLEQVDKLANSPGFNTSRVLNQLVRRDLLAKRITDDKPRRREYVTTDRFLAVFNMSSIEDLPRSEDPQ